MHVSPHVLYRTRQKKVANTVYHFSVFSSVFCIVPFYRSVLPFYRSKYRLSGVAGEYLEVLKLGRSSATILMVDTYAELFGELPIRASGPSAATCAARWFDKSQLGVDTTVPLQLEFIHAHAQELACEHASLLERLNDNAQR